MPKGNPDDPAWRYVQASLSFASNRARQEGYTWRGDCCYVVAALALQAVILTRNGKTIESGSRKGQYIIATDNPRDINLAYCDHYLHMRGEAARLGPNWRWKLEAQTKGYDAVKGAIHTARNVQTGNFGVGGPPNPMNAVKLLGEVADWALREGDAPLSKPSEVSLYWGLEGIKDGLEDYKNNPGIDNDPTWYKKLRDG